MLAAEGTYSREIMTPPEATFTSARLAFQKLDVADEPVLWKLMSDQEVVRWIGIDPKTDRIETRDQLLKDFQEGKRFKFFWSIRWKTPGPDSVADMIGWILFRPTEDGRSVEIGYWLLPEIWGKGVATEAARKVLDILPAAMGVSVGHVTAMVAVGNHTSRRVLEKSGLYVVREKDEYVRMSDRTVRVWWFEWAAAAGGQPL